MRYGFTSHGFFSESECGVPPRQIQTDNDASGNPQRVAGRLQDVPYDIAYRRCKCTVLQYAKKTRPSALCVGAVPKGGPPRINDDTHNRYMRHGFANCELRPAVCEWCFLRTVFYGIPTTGRQPPLSVLAATLHFPLVSAGWAKKAFRMSPTEQSDGLRLLAADCLRLWICY